MIKPFMAGALLIIVSTTLGMADEAPREPDRSGHETELSRAASEAVALWHRGDLNGATAAITAALDDRNKPITRQEFECLVPAIAIHIVQSSKDGSLYRELPDWEEESDGKLALVVPKLFGARTDPGVHARLTNRSGEVLSEWQLWAFSFSNKKYTLANPIMYAESPRVPKDALCSAGLKIILFQPSRDGGPSFTFAEVPIFPYDP